MRDKIKSFAAGLGIKEVGFTEYNGKTAVVCLFPYFSEYHPGNLSVYAYSLDYHKIIKEKLGLLGEFIINNGASEAESYADIGPEIDKNLAWLAGLGFYGKNSLLINPRLGSYFFIGYILTDLKTETDGPLDMKCQDCGRCVAACPGGALDTGFDPSRCVSALTQKKGELTADEQELIKKAGYAFGCDICQKVCPHNAIEFSPMPEFSTDRIFNLTADMFDGLSNRDFKEKYGKYAFAWRGKSVLIRNIEILCKNRLKP